MAAGVVIAGAGPAGVTIAQGLRAQDPDLAITLISAEPFAPYSPPAMADYFMTGRDQTLFWKGTDFCERMGINYLSNTTIDALAVEDKTLLLADGSNIGFEQLVIATGSGLYAPVHGHDLDGVFNFKSLSAATRLVEAVRKGAVRRAVIVGGGFIGVELALLLRSLNVDVVMVDREDRIMHRMLDAETAQIVLDQLIAHGVTVRLRTEAHAFVGDRHAEGVELGSGEVLHGDAYVAATGVKPNVEWLTGSALTHDWGITVDDCLCTTAEGVWAAGDVAETRDLLTGERYVHAIFPNAIAQAHVVTRGLLGLPSHYAGAEAMNSLKHLGVEVMAVGASSGDEELRYRRGGLLRKVFLRDGRIVGFRLAGDISAAGAYRSLMLRGVDVTRWRNGLLDARPGAVWMRGALAASNI